MSLDLFKTGSTSAYNFDVPTNPLMTSQSTFSGTFTDDTCDVTAGNTTIVHDANSKIKTGLIVTGIGILENTTITGITDTTHFVISTTPNISSTNTTLSFESTNRMFSAIYTDDSEESVYSEVIGSATLQAEYENLSATKGHNIHCFDTVSSTGVSLATIDDATGSPNIETHYYFVLIHSDDHLQHHFARITEIKTSDVLGDSFDFEPKLGNEIAQGTKFKLFKGPAIASKGVAFSAGIKMDLQNSLHVARPHFWFVNDSLDRKNQLDHNTKYFARLEIESEGSSITLDAVHKVTFVTVTDYGQKIVDYSKYSLNATISDNLRTQDVIGTYTLNESGSGTPALATQNDAVYDTFAPNARRDTDNTITDAAHYSFKGPKRYLHYGYSPTKNNSTANVIDLEVEESIGKKSSYAEIKIADSYRILSKKINTYDALRVRQTIHRGDFNDWISFGATISSYTSTNGSNQALYAINTPVDLSLYLNINDEVLINSNIMVIVAISSSTIRFRIYHRLETESIFTNMTSDERESVPADAVIYRRAWNKIDSTLLTGMRMIDGRQDDLYVSSISNEFSQLEATVDSYISETGLLTLSLFNQGYDTTTALDKMTGQYIIYNEKLNGRTTSVKQEKENGQTVMLVTGADKLRELLGPIVEKNTLFSKDIVYSTDSPYNKVTALGVNATCEFTNDDLTLSGSGASLVVGDKIFAKSASGTMIYLGEIGTRTSDTAYVFTSFCKGQVSAKAAYKASTKYSVFNKALSSNHFVSSTTSLYGTANKGLFFESGTKLVAGVEGDILASSSINTINPNAKGYYLSEAKNIKSDNLFQARLDDNATSKSYATFDTVNTLIDFNILSIEEIDGNQVIEIAPHIPLTLGRVDVNYANTQDTTFTTLGTSTAAITSTTQRFIQTTVAASIQYSSIPIYLSGETTTNPPRHYHGKAIYLNSVFVGFMTLAVLQNDQSTIKIYLDRALPVTLSSATISALQGVIASGVVTKTETTKLTHELSLLNAGHLHGGKIITLLNPTRDTTSSVDGATIPLDFPLAYSSGSYSVSNSDRFGSPYYRIFNLEKGNVSFKKPNYTDEKANSIYEHKLTNIPYYASAYKFDPSHYIDSGLQRNITGVNKMDNVDRQHTLIESRGYFPPSGSNFFDTTVHDGNDVPLFTNFHFEPHQHHNTTISSTNHAEKTPFAIKDFLWLPDAKVARMFLFINSDLRPYSATRKDSILNSATRDISKYNLFALTPPSLTINSDTKDNSGINTNTINVKDSNYSSSSIISSDKTLSSLTGFGMMRLTELCLDWSFNQFDPENPPDRKTTMPKFEAITHTKADLGTLHATQNANLLILTFTGDVVIADGDLILDANGRFIGVADGASDGTDDDEVLLHENRYNTNGIVHNTTSSSIKKITNTYMSYASGHGEKDSFMALFEDIHMQKGMVMNKAAGDPNADSGYSRAQWFDKFGTYIGIGSNSAGGSADRKHNLIAPINFSGGSRLMSESTSNVHSSHLLELIDNLTLTVTTEGHTSIAPTTNDESIMEYWLPIFLDRWSIEDIDSELVSSGMVGSHIKTVTKVYDDVGSSAQTYGLLGYSLTTPFANSKTQDGKAVDGANIDTLADGALVGFKPRLYLSGGEDSSDVSIGGSTIYRYNLVAAGRYKWLSFVNLTGTYVIPDKGRYVDADGSLGTVTASEGQTQSMNGVNVEDLPYCISHEIDHSDNTETHILTMDYQLVAGWHRIMQPNHTCTYDFSPKEIDLNVLGSKYTKMPYEEKMYDGTNNYALHNASGDITLQGNNEGVLSMYVIIDLDHKGHADQHRNIVPSYFINDILEGVSGNFCISDGDTTYSSTMVFTEISEPAALNISFDKMKKTLGVVSVSEITSITVGGETPINENSKRAMIGSVVNICNETEDIIEELLEEQGTPFAITREDYPLFLAPNFDGVTLFQAINFLLQKKDKTLIQTKETFTIKNKEDSNFYHNLLISDNGDIRIYEYEVLKSTFEEYNEIIVYGKAHKAKRRDMRSILKIGKKSLKVFERKLTTQEEVDTRAKILLRLHKGDNKKLRVTVGHANISQIRVGDIVSVEIKQENIPKNKYLVLEITHTLTGLMELELGKYTHSIEDRFSELAIDVDTAQTQQNPKINESNIGLGFLETIKIKPLRLLVRKRTTSGSMTLGFTTALNTGTAQLGFTGGASIGYTDLVEEEF